MKRLVTLVTLLTLVAMAASGQKSKPTDTAAASSSSLFGAFRGIPLGASQHDAVTLLPTLKCEQETAESVRACTTEVTVDGVSVQRVDRPLFCQGKLMKEVPVPGRVECTQNGTIADVATDESYYFFDDKFLAMNMTFKTASYDPLRAAFLAKYGAPTSTHTETLQNLVGGKFDNEVLEWVTPESTVMLKRFWLTGYERVLGMQGIAVVNERHHADEMAAQAAEKLKKTAKSF